MVKILFIAESAQVDLVGTSLMAWRKFRDGLTNIMTNMDGESTAEHVFQVELQIIYIENVAE